MHARMHALRLAQLGEGVVDTLDEGASDAIEAKYVLQDGSGSSVAAGRWLQQCLQAARCDSACKQPAATVLASSLLRTLTWPKPMVMAADVVNPLITGNEMKSMTNPDKRTMRFPRKQTRLASWWTDPVAASPWPAGTRLP